MGQILKYIPFLYNRASDNNVLENKFLFFRKKLLRNIVDYGLRTSFRKMIEFILRPIYQRSSFILYELSLTNNVVDKNCSNDEYTFRMLKPEDVDYIDQIEKTEEWLKGKIQERLRGNGICMAVIKDKQVAGFNLATLGEGVIPLLKLRVITGEDEAWSEQITILKEHRKRGLGSELRSRFYKELRKNGIKTLYGHRQIWNIASEKSARKYLSRELVKADYIRRLIYNRLIYTNINHNSSKQNRFSKINDQTSNIMHYCYPIPMAEKNTLFTLDISDFKQ